MTAAKDLKGKLTLPVIVSPMFLVSNPEMAIAACRDGVVGSFPSLNQRTSAGFEQWLIQMNTALDAARAQDPAAKIAPYAVNLIVSKSYAENLNQSGADTRLADDIDLCVKHKVPVIITSMGLSKDLIDKIHSYGGIVLHDVTNITHAKKAVAAGVDGLIAVASGAGGNAGTQNPFALIGEIRQFFDGPLALAGCISTGRDILAAESMGADFAYMGTRFLSTTESQAADGHKDMVKSASSADVIYTSGVSGIPANFLRDSLKKAGFDVDRLKKEGAGAQKQELPPEKAARAWKDVWSAGQGVGNISDAPSVHDLIDRLKKEYAAAEDAEEKRIKGKRKPPSPY